MHFGKPAVDPRWVLANPRWILSNLFKSAVDCRKSPIYSGFAAHSTLDERHYLSGKVCQKVHFILGFQSAFSTQSKRALCFAHSPSFFIWASNGCHIDNEPNIVQNFFCLAQVMSRRYSKRCHSQKLFTHHALST